MCFRLAIEQWEIVAMRASVRVTRVQQRGTGCSQAKMSVQERGRQSSDAGALAHLHKRPSNDVSSVVKGQAGKTGQAIERQSSAAH